MKRLFDLPRNRVIASAAAVIVAVIVIVAGASWYYQGHALPGASVGSVPVGGKDPGQVQMALEEPLNTQQIKVQTPAGALDANPADMGIDVNLAATVDAVFDRSFIPGIFQRAPIVPVMDIDDAQLKEFTENLPLPDGAIARDASVTFDEATGTFTAQEGQAGQQIELQPLTEEIVATTASLKSGTVEAVLVHKEPAVSPDQASEVAATLNQWLTKPIRITDQDGDVLEADTTTKAQWVTFTTKDGTFEPVVDEGAVEAWVKEFASQSETAPVQGLRNVDSAGAQVAVSLPAEDGWTVTNTDEIVNSIVASTATVQSVDQEFAYADAPATWEDRPAAPGAENLVYRPAVGEKWIDLDLENSTVTAYEGTTVVGGPFYMVPGAPETPTVEGEYNIYLKYDIQDMRGSNVDGSTYLTEDVPWVSYFYGGYGFHGAPWRSTFGWNGPGGSHGCINMEVPEAQFIHEWADMGTKVVSHY